MVKHTETTVIWPQRLAVLGLLGAVLGWCVADLTDTPNGQTNISLCAGLVVFGLAFGLLWDRHRTSSAVLFAIGAAIVAGLAGWWSGVAAVGMAADAGRLPAAVTAIAVAVPLFQAYRLQRNAGSGAIAYSEAHDQAWTDLVVVAAALAFALASWLLAGLLASLFGLIGIAWPERVLQEIRIVLTLLGAAIGVGGALARDQSRILSTMQRVLRAVLSALTPVLAAGLLLFVALLPATGLESLWQATKATTPILLFCVAAGLVLANAVIADAPANEAHRPTMRRAGFVLVALMLPLAMIACYSTGQRVQQYGWTPSRLWALVAVLVALGYGLAGLWAVLRPANWMARVRRGNMIMALLLCVVALMLATPALDFGGIATRSQVARLKSGKVTPDKFDWAALRFDFGRAGETALRALSQQPGESGRLAVAALAAENRWELNSRNQREPRFAPIAMILVPLDAGGKSRSIPPGLHALIRDSEPDCANGGQLCVVHWPANSGEAVLFVGIGNHYESGHRRFLQQDGVWRERLVLDDSLFAESGERTHQRMQQYRDAIVAGRYDIRPIPGEQLLINRVPVATAVDPP